MFGTGPNRPLANSKYATRVVSAICTNPEKEDRVWPVEGLMDRQFIIGLSVSVLSFFLRYAVKDMPKSMAWSGVLVGVVLMAVGLAESSIKPPLSVVLLTIVGIICFGLATHFYLNRDSRIHGIASPVPAQLPDRPQ